MKFKKYNGKDKYHFRVYKTSINHPFIVVAITEEKEENGRVLISGYMMTTSLQRVLDKPNSYKRLKVNPNPHDDGPSFVNKYRLTDIPANRFSKPYSNWHLSKEDENLIDSLEFNFSKNKNNEKAP